MVNKIVTTARNGIAAYDASKKRKSLKILPIIFVLAYVVMGIITFGSVLSLLPMIAACVYTVTIYWCDVKKIRYAYVFSNAIWLVYNVYVFSLVGIIAQIILVINGLIAVYRYRKKHRKQVS